MEENDRKKKPLFVDGVWWPMTQNPFHNGRYQVQVKSGDIIDVRWKNGKWKGPIDSFAQWRGRELADITTHKPHRRKMNLYHISKPEKYAIAAKGAWLLARRAVGMKRSGSAYKYYLVAHAIANQSLKRADKEWIERFKQNPVNESLVEEQRAKVDRFFKKRGGRPPAASIELGAIGR